MKSRVSLAVCAIIAETLVVSSSWGWGGPHGTITQAALKTLPAWQREALGTEGQALGALYCTIPDLVYTRKDLAPYAMAPEQPGTVYLVNLHLPASSAGNEALLRSFMGRAVEALRTNNVADAARFAGTLAHMLEDWGCPAHAVPGDNMFTLFKQFLPPPDAYRYTPLHGPVENGTFALDLGGRRPRLLGATVGEAAFNLLQRSQEATVLARAQVIPIIQALYAGDTNACNAAQQRAAAFDAAIVSDALYTVLCIGCARVVPEEAASLTAVDLSGFAPLEAPDLYMPQSCFFSKPFWGYVSRGVSPRDGKDPVPLRLLVADDGGQPAVKTFATGWGTGTRSSLSFLVPPEVYGRFRVRAGLHAELGANGQVRFEVLGNGRRLATVGPLDGTLPSKPIDVAVTGVTNLQLVAVSAGGNGSGNYAVWAEPQLIKDKLP